MLACKPRERYAPTTAVWPHLVVVGPSECDLASGLGQTLEPVLVQALLEELSVEALDVSVASRTITWPLIEQMRMALVPVLHGLHGRFAFER